MMIYVIILAIGVLRRAPAGATGVERPVAAQGAQAPGGTGQGAAWRRRLAANAQAQIRKLMAARASRVEGFASTLIPKPALLRKRLEQTGKNITLGKYAADFARPRRRSSWRC